MKVNWIEKLFCVPKAKKKAVQFLHNWHVFVSYVVIVCLIAVWGNYFYSTSRAAGIDSVVTTLVDSSVVSTESQITVVFTPITALIVTDTITVYIGEDSGGDPWVDTDGTVDSTDITCAGTGYTFGSYVQTDATASTALLASCDVTVLADGTNPVTMTIGSSSSDSLYNPAGADGYSVAVVTNDDFGAGIAYVGSNNSVAVSASTIPNLQLTVSTADGTFCTATSGVISCNLGVVLTSAENDGSYDVDVGTSAASGSTVSLGEDGNLRYGANDINDVGDGDITAGSEEYGVILTETGTAWTIDLTYAATEAPIITGPDVAATSGGPVDASTDNIDVTHRVAVATSTLGLTYTHIATWTAVANF